MDAITISSLSQMAEAAVRLEQAGDKCHPVLLRAAMAGALRLCFVLPGARLPLKVLNPMRDSRPLAVVFAGDGVEPTGPESFPQAMRALRWSKRIMIHGTGGQPAHYALAVQATLACGRLVLIETCSAFEPTWTALATRVAANTPTLRIIIPPGAPPHPCLGAPAGVVIQ
jgi:hypothetical protein